MSSVQVLLSALQDPPHALNAPEDCCVLLHDLLTICRREEPRQELLQCGGLDVLADFAAAAAEASSSSTASANALHPLLELTATLACDRNRTTKTRLAERPPLLALPLHCLRVFAAKKPGKKRNRSMRIAMELLEMLRGAALTRRDSHQHQLTLALLRVTENPEEDSALLRHAVGMLVSSMESNATNIHTAAKYNAVPILLRLFDAPMERTEIKRSACEALLVVSTERELVPVIVSNDAIHSIALCLRLRAVQKDVEVGALKLLARLCDESQVFGQLVNQDMVPVLFQTIERSSDIGVTKPACRILEGIASFARGCKLDLSPFIYARLPCRGVVIVQAIACHAHDVGLVISGFRFFASVMRNPVELPALITGDTLEGLFALYIVHCGSVSSAASDLGDLLAAIVASMSHTTIEMLVLQQADQSLPALFLCLRSHSTDRPFVANVFALVARHWRSSRPSTRRAHTLSGFIGIAVELLLSCCRENGGVDMIECVELYDFLREILTTHEGGEVALACGGISLSRTLAQQLLKRSAKAEIEQNDSAPLLTYVSFRGPHSFLTSESTPDSPILRMHVQEMARTVSDMLASAIDRAVKQAAMSKEVNLDGRGGDGSWPETPSPACSHEPTPAIAEYRDFLEESLSRGRSEKDGAGSSSGVVDAAVNREVCYCVESCREGRVNDEEVFARTGDVEDADRDDEPNDDGSDSDGADEDRVGNIEPAKILERLGLPDDTLSTTKAEARDDFASASRIKQGSVGRQSSPRHARLSSPDFHAIDFSKLRQSTYCYVDSGGIQYPKHPGRDAASSLPADSDPSSHASKKTDGFLLLHDPPTQSEPCRPPDAVSMAAFIGRASRQREDFVTSDPLTRARLVYENTSGLLETRGADTQNKSCASSLHYPYDVPEEAKAFSGSPSLTFDSWFECGNLERAIQVGEFEYDLILRSDLNTTGHMQWFYFAVSNMLPFDSGSGSNRPKYRFNIVNLCKPDSLFNQGLRPVVYSVRDAVERRIGWRRGGEDIYYFSNPFQRPNKVEVTSDQPDRCFTLANSNPVIDAGAEHAPVSARAASPTQGAVGTFYTLTFTLDFANTDDTYLIAHSYPFTFSDHQRHLQRTLHQHRPSRRRTPEIIKHSVLCTTILGRPCDLLTITDFSVSTPELKARRAVILTARVHPGETQASWIMRGVIDFLVSGSEVARVLRRLFVFRVVPMLNPDGVFHGNSRCSLSACDLNRHWHNPSKQLHPTIYHMKELARSELTSRGVVFFCDIHGHSRKKNVFMYGCDTKKRPNPRARHFAKLFSTQPAARRFISFVDCSFKVSKDKETTARVVLTKELRLAWCFTLEASFGGASFGELQDTHFNTAHLRQVGGALCETLLQACITDVGLREHVMSLVDDYTVCIASIVDSHLREAGIVSDSSCLQPDAASQSLSGLTPRKDKSTNSSTTSAKSGMKRESLRSRRDKAPPVIQVVEADRKATTTHSSASRSGRRIVSKRVGTTSLPRRKSSPAASASAAEALREKRVVTNEPGKKPEAANENAVARARRRHSSIPHSEGPGAGTNLQRQRPLIDLLRSFELPEEDDTQLSKLQSLVRGSSSTSSSSGHSGSQPTTPDTPPQHQPFRAEASALYRSSPSHRRMAAALLPQSNRPRETASPPSSVFRFPARDAVPVILPPPVNDVALTRSPRPPCKTIRFKGAGRQYAALNSPSRVSSSVELAVTTSSPAADASSLGRDAVARPIWHKTGSTASTVGYEPDLINASAIPLKQRASGVGACTTAPFSTAEAVPPTPSTRLPSTTTSTGAASLLGRHSFS